MFQRFTNKTFTSIKRSCHKLLGIFERRHNFRGLYLKLGCLKRNIIVFQTSTVARALELMIYFPHMDEPVSIRLLCYDVIQRNIIVFQTSTVGACFGTNVYFLHMDEPVSIDYFGMS